MHCSTSLTYLPILPRLPRGLVLPTDSRFADSAYRPVPSQSVADCLCPYCPSIRSVAIGGGFGGAPPSIPRFNVHPGTLAKYIDPSRRTECLAGRAVAHEWLVRTDALGWDDSTHSPIANLAHPDLLRPAHPGAFRTRPVEPTPAVPVSTRVGTPAREHPDPRSWVTSARSPAGMLSVDAARCVRDLARRRSRNPHRQPCRESLPHHTARRISLCLGTAR